MGYNDPVANKAISRYEKVVSRYERIQKGALLGWHIESSYQKQSDQYTVLICYKIAQAGALGPIEGGIPFGFTGEELREMIPDDITESFSLHAFVRAVSDRQKVRRGSFEEAIQGTSAKNLIGLFESLNSREFLRAMAQDEAFIKMALSTRDFHQLLQKKSSDE